MVKNCAECGVQEGFLHQPDCAVMLAHENGEDTPQATPSRYAGLKPPWKPGQSGNPAGRPKGARSKLSEAFFEALAADFEEHGIKALELMRAERPNEYIKAIAALQSKEITGEDGESLNLGVAIFKGLNENG